MASGATKVDPNAENHAAEKIHVSTIWSRSSIWPPVPEPVKKEKGMCQGQRDYSG